MSGFLEELKRRRVVRVALVYGAVAFAVFQFADLVFPRIGLPERAVTLVIVLGLIGFPVAIALGWAFDVTPEGLRRTDAAGDDRVDASALPWLSARTVVATVTLLAAAVAAGWLAGRGGAARTASAEAVSSIAVLPFANLSGNEEDEYFSDGLAEEILNLVARIEGLQVAARTSAFAFKGRDMDVRAIGDSLGVATVLQGSVRREGGRVRVTAQLSDVSNGYSMWSDRFDAELSGIFQVQEQIASAIADALQLRLAPIRVAGRAPTVDAHDLYLLGLNSFHQRAIAEAVSYFRRATQADPDYAEAWGGLAMAHAISPVYVGRFCEDCTTPPAVVEPLAAADSTRVAAERAMQLDDRLAEPHAALCQSVAYLEYGWEEAERECDAALLRNPSSAIAHQWRAELLLITRRFAEADSAVERSLELDPRALIAPLVGASIAFTAGDLAETERRLRRHLPADPSPTTGFLLRDLLILRGDSAGLRAHLEEVDPVRAPLAARLIAARSDPGLRAEALAMVDTDPPPGGRRFALERASTRALYGDFEGALRLLEESFAQREFNLPLVIGTPTYEPLRNSPRFQRIVSGLGLAPYW